MNDFICKNFINDMNNSEFDPNTYIALLCGSSLFECDPRDTDIFIYTLGDEKSFCSKLTVYLSQIDKNVRFSYLDSLEFYSVKYISSGIPYSLHIVSKRKLYDRIQKADCVETYTDINIFDVKLYSQTVYRKWIIETRYLIGNRKIKNDIKQELIKKKIPENIAREKLICRIKNNINYFNEKVSGEDDIVLCNFIVGQIVNNLINYLYLVNGCYYGTLKYIKTDLEHFEKDAELSKLTINIIKSINIKDVSEISILINKIISFVT